MRFPFSKKKIDRQKSYLSVWERREYTKLVMTQNDDKHSVAVYMALADALSVVVRHVRSDQAGCTDILERDGERNAICSLLQYMDTVRGSLQDSDADYRVKDFVKCLKDLLESKDKDLLFGSLSRDRIEALLRLQLSGKRRQLAEMIAEQDETLSSVLEEGTISEGMKEVAKSAYQTLTRTYQSRYRQE